MSPPPICWRPARSMRSPRTTCRTALWRPRSNVPGALACRRQLPWWRSGRHGWPASTIAAGWKRDSAPIWCASGCMTGCRWYGRSGGPASVSPDARVAVYYAPLPDDVLFADAAAWLGRDPANSATIPQPDIANIAEITAEPRLYGFHATLKPPLRLVNGCKWDDVIAVTAELAGRIAPFDLPPLSVQDLFGFLALRETAPSAPLQALADACVEQLDRFRAPPSEAELTRRRRGNRTPRQDAMLVRWGYPYVFDT